MSHLNTGFQLLEMQAPDGELVENLVHVYYNLEKGLEYEKYDKDEPYYIDKIIALEGAARYGADYVYFRLFPERPPLAQIYVYNYVDKPCTEGDLTKLHRRLWSAVQVPMFFVFTEKEIKVFNAFQEPVVGKQIKAKPLEIIKLVAEVDEKVQAFSSRKFDNGAFWETSIYAGKIKFSGSAYEQLLKELKNTLKDLVKEKILPDEKIAKKLLIRAILIKYLEEREDEKGNTVFPKKGESRQFENGQRRVKKFEHDFFEEFAENATSFTDVLKHKGACVKLFEYLSKHFNGEIFKLESKEAEFLGNADLSRLSYFLEDKLRGKQYTLFQLYSFNDLPIELISNVYEEFLESKPGVVYTPPYLVNFLLEEAMPLNDNRLIYKILDPACGSGVFLVGAYKRLIYRWRASNGWGKPSIVDLKKLLKDNIFGVDEMEEAVNLSMFSLSLALCDELSPIVIWDELKFDSLKGSNLFDKDFFELIEDGNLSDDFDLVIGNPPFKPEFSEAAKRLESKRIEDKKERGVEIDGKTEKVKIPGNQIALLFLDQAIQLCKPDGLLCLILPSTDFLYNHNSDKYRTYFLQNYKTPEILDFTNLSGCLFGNANVSVIAIFAQNQKPENLESIQHITVRRNQAAEERLFFELDYYDFHAVPFDDSIGKSFIWKANLFGGGRLGRVIAKINRIKPTVGEYLTEKIKKSGWQYGEGFIVGDRKKISIRERIENGSLAQNELTEFEIEEFKKNYKAAPWVTNMPFIDADFFDSKGVDRESISITREKFFIRNRKKQKKIFDYPHILIKEVISDGSIPVDFFDEYLVFGHRIIGIHSPVEDRPELIRLHDFLNNNLVCLFHIVCTSPEYAVSRKNMNTITKGDIDDIPYPSSGFHKFNLSHVDSILMQDTINYWLNYSTGSKASELPLFNNTLDADLQKFGETYCDILNSVYEDFHPMQPLVTENFVCFPFYIGEKPEIEWTKKEDLEKHLTQLLVRENLRANLRMIRIMRLYEGNVIYLIKPKQLRYWLRSVAIRDADETFAYLVAQEYQL